MTARSLLALDWARFRAGWGRTLRGATGHDRLRAVRGLVVSLAGVAVLYQLLHHSARAPAGGGGAIDPTLAALALCLSLLLGIDAMHRGRAPYTALECWLRAAGTPPGALARRRSVLFVARAALLAWTPFLLLGPSLALVPWPTRLALPLFGLAAALHGAAWGRGPLRRSRLALPAAYGLLTALLAGIWLGLFAKEGALPDGWWLQIPVGSVMVVYGPYGAILLLALAGSGLAALLATERLDAVAGSPARRRSRGAAPDPGAHRAYATATGAFLAREIRSLMATPATHWFVLGFVSVNVLGLHMAAPMMDEFAGGLYGEGTGLLFAAATLFLPMAVAGELAWKAGDRGHWLYLRAVGAPIAPALAARTALVAVLPAAVLAATLAIGVVGGDLSAPLVLNGLLGLGMVVFGAAAVTLASVLAYRLGAGQGSFAQVLRIAGVVASLVAAAALDYAAGPAAAFLLLVAAGASLAAAGRLMRTVPLPSRAEPVRASP